MSKDNGVTWSEPISVFHDMAGCPNENQLFTWKEGNIILESIIQDQVYLIAWDGNEWSDPQLQEQFLNFIDPTRMRSVTLDCRQAVLNNEERLYMIGCEAEGDGDIWLLSQEMGVITDWFPPPTNWTSPVQITSSPDNISNLLLSTDNEGLFHAMWLQKQDSEVVGSVDLVYYSRFENESWSSPVSILTSPDGTDITNLSLTIDQNDRLLIVWTAGETGNIYFSWAGKSRAFDPSEWNVPISLPVSQPYASSPVIIADKIGRISVAYAIPINDERGIYVTQSFDDGDTWSDPTIVFNAALENWDMLTIPN
jgi:hypothetical protein